MSTKLKTVNIKGREYVEVNERIKYFRENYKDWSLQSDIVSIENGVCVIKATIADENGMTRATGIAYEKEGSTFINKTSYIENCETSAWGRALGNLGIGIDTSIASSNEVQNAMANQKKNSNLVEQVELQDIKFQDLGQYVEAIKACENLEELGDLNKEAKVIARSEKQRFWLDREYKKRKEELLKALPEKEYTGDNVKDYSLPF